RHCGGEPRQQRRARRRARTARLARADGVEPRRAQLDLVARQLASAARTADARRMDLVGRDEQVGEARLIAYGHYGRPLLAFPSELGHRWDFEQTGMLEAVAPLVEAGRVKVYCVDSGDAWSWRADDLPLEERARQLHASPLSTQ